MRNFGRWLARGFMLIAAVALNHNKPLLAAVAAFWGLFMWMVFEPEYA